MHDWQPPSADAAARAHVVAARLTLLRRAMMIRRASAVRGDHCRGRIHRAAGGWRPLFAALQVASIVSAPSASAQAAGWAVHGVRRRAGSSDVRARRDDGWPIVRSRWRRIS
jgi:hypothetical protein